MIRPATFSLLLVSYLAVLSPTFAQTTIEKILGDPSGMTVSRAISADGVVVVGEITSASHPTHAFRWTEAGGIQDLGTHWGDGRSSYATGVSADGNVVVGYSDAGFEIRAFRWTATGGMQDLPIGIPDADSFAYGVSSDGSVAVGAYRPSGGDRHAFRWTADDGLQDLGTLGGVEDEDYSEATAVSSDGSVVVGHSMSPSGQVHAFRWKDGVMQDLGTIGNAAGSSSANGVSADGSVVVGESMSPSGDTVAFRWMAGAMQDLGALSAVDGDGNVHRYSSAYSVSGNGSVIAGETSGGACVWTDGGAPRLLADVLRDDYGVDLAAGGLTGLWNVHGCSSDGLELTGEGSYDMALLCSYRVRLSPDGVPNRPPTVGPLAPVTLECVEGHHRVTLSTTVNDPDGQALTATWKVNGEVKKSQPGVAPETSISFEFDYPHGVHNVSVEVSDGALTTTGGTIVTVRDTTVPIVVVAGNVTVATDPGKAFATNVTLPLPTATDASGHPVTLTHNAPSRFDLGTTVVVWTATDESGNFATAPQKVIVQDREKPKIVPLPPIRKFCDPGKLVATVALVKPKATDNVPGTQVTTKAGKTFKIGTTNVLWTAKDAAGNTANWTQKVIVTNRAPKANAGPDRTITTASERGVRVVLDGSKSSDPDKQALKYAWTAKKVKFSNGTTAKPSGIFPVGTTVVTLTVTDAGGLKRTDTVRVTVKLKNGKRRPRGSDANRSFAAATRQASQVVAEKGSRSGAALSGLAYANAASAYGDAAGECVLWEEGQSEADATLAYAQLRAVQRTYGQAAASALLSAYAETGDENLLSAYGYTAYGSAYAAADLSER